MSATAVAAHRLPDVLVGVGNTLFRHRNVLFPIVFLVLLFAARPRYPFGSLQADRLLDACGLLITLAGQAIRALVIGLAYIQRGGRGGKVHADALVQEGIFAHCRNPLYVGNILVFTGLFVVVNSPLGWFVGIPAVLFAYVAIVAAEEAYLRQRFGAEYEAYCRRVPRFWIAWGGLRRTLQGFHFEWQRVVKKEYGSTLAWTTTLLVVLIWERVANGDAAAVRAHWPIYAGIWVALVVLWYCARRYKKAGRAAA
jgi:protein-S-isoprenylcysteine O-methyltransferase Ste14